MTRTVFSLQHVAMARIPLRPADPNPADDSAGLLEEGVFLASRSAAQAAEAPRTLGTSRIAATWRAYDIRSRFRTTPHGVFSAVAPATFTDQATALTLSAGPRAVTSPSPAWLTGVADQLLDAEEVLLRLTLTANNLGLRRGDRLEAEHPAPNGGTAQLSNVRATGVSVWLLEACRGGMRAAEVFTGLTGRYPAAGQAAVGTAVRQMIRSGLLLTDLLPADLRNDPLGHLLQRLPASAVLRSDVVRLRDLLARADTYPPGATARLELLRAARQTADAVVRVERPLTADTFTNTPLALPRALGEQAAQAAGVLWHVSQLTNPATNYQEKFVRAYGHHRLVPLLDVIDPAIGIGPATKSDNIGAEGDLDARRAALLARLLAKATASGQAEIIVDDELIERLAHGSGASPPRTAEIHVRLLRHGDELRLAVCPDAGSQDAGSAAGRFARWLPELAPNTSEEDGGPLIAEIVCRPRTGPTATLAVETGFAPHRIPLGVPEREGDLTPDDLMITTTGGHLTVWSARHHRPVIPVLFSRLAPDRLPPAGRTLHLIGHAGTRPWHTWSWGPAGYAPCTPRVRYRNVLLAPARWALPEELTDAAARRTSWDKALAAWRNDTVPTPPDVVMVQESDRQIPLDLRLDDDRELLRRSVHRGAGAVTEPLVRPDEHGAVLEGPGGGHVVELVVNLTRHAERSVPRLDPRVAVHRHDTRRSLPGSSWLSAAIPVPAVHQDTALRQLPSVLAPAAGYMDHWFWLRYYTPALGDHLRIRVHGRPDALTAHVLPLLTVWCCALNGQRIAGGLVLESYMPETERYGGPAAITAAEAVFAADSSHATQCLTRTSAMDDRMTVAAMSAWDIARTVAARPDEALRAQRLTPSGRRLRDSLRARLRAIGAEPTALIPTQLTTPWNARHETLTAYQAVLTHPQVSGLCASDLVHMHCNRLLGSDPAHENVARSLAMDLLHVHARDGRH